MKLAQIEQQNSDLKKNLADFKEESKEKWDSFKVKFSHDMDNLGKALKAFTVKGK
jgi:molybdopterin synthase catalytic subunit